jgi:hypothetical protein
MSLIGGLILRYLSLWAAPLSLFQEMIDGASPLSSWSASLIDGFYCRVTAMTMDGVLSSNGLLSASLSRGRQGNGEWFNADIYPADHYQALLKYNDSTSQ